MNIRMNGFGRIVSFRDQLWENLYRLLICDQIWESLYIFYLEDASDGGVGHELLAQISAQVLSGHRNLGRWDFSPRLFRVWSLKDLDAFPVDLKNGDVVTRSSGI